MSHYDWESGHFKLSCKEYGKFKKALRDRWNASMTKAHAKAVEIQQALVRKFKGKRNVNWRAAIYEHRENSGYIGGMRYAGHTIECMAHGERIKRSLRNADDSGNWKKPLKPKKKDFPLKTNKDHMFADSYGECTVTFDDKTRTVYWGVSENNKACERARESTLGQIFFKLLGEVKWTRGTGGEIIGNDEYNVDAGEDYVGGGGNYLKEAYGPKAQKAAQHRRRMSMAY